MPSPYTMPEKKYENCVFTLKTLFVRAHYAGEIWLNSTISGNFVLVFEKKTLTGKPRDYGDWIVYEHYISNCRTIDPTEILLSWCIRAAKSYYSYNFSLQMASWFSDRLRLNFLAFAWRGIYMTARELWYWFKRWLISGKSAIWTVLVLE